MASLDPYARPAGELSETEKRIAVAAFGSASLSIGSMGRFVPVVLNRPVLLSRNDKSDVLVVSFQVTTSPSIVRGLLGSTSSLFAGSAFRVALIHSDPPIQQILLAGEQLWFVPDTIIGPASLIVTEVTP